jgi:hypothetical protein
MFRRTVLALTAAAIAAVVPAGSAAADFPEQPGNHPATACAAVATHNFNNASPVGASITEALFADACFGG